MRRQPHKPLLCSAVSVDYLVTAWADLGYQVKSQRCLPPPATQDTRICLPESLFPYRVSLSRRLPFYPKGFHFCVTLSKQRDGAECSQAGLESPSPILQHCSSVGEGSVLRPSRPPPKLPFTLHTVKTAKVVCHAKSSYRKARRKPGFCLQPPS